MENSSLEDTGGNQNKEISVKEYKSRKDSFKFVLYANASGTHKLMPLVINRALKDHKKKLPVTFKSQTRLNSMTVLRYRENLEKQKVQNIFTNYLALHARYSLKDSITYSLTCLFSSDRF